MTRKTTTELIELRTAAGLSQRALALALGVSHETIRQLEQDHRAPTAIEAAAIRSACAEVPGRNGHEDREVEQLDELLERCFPMRAVTNGSPEGLAR
jgi:transcriptional regulator with XRE-family HTH domain